MIIHLSNEFSDLKEKNHADLATGKLFVISGEF
jgi:hypothetical protein